MSRLLPTLGLLALAACSSGDARRPNVVLVVVDTLRADYLGVYGFDGAISPTIDALARESVVFDNAFAQSPWTKPSTASLFTSLYPQVHGLTNHEGLYWGGDTPEQRTGILPAKAVTLAEAFQASGYRTAAFVTNPWLIRDYGFSQGFDLFDDYAAAIDAPADAIIEQAMAWVEAQRDDRPFFLYLHFMDVHAPYDAPKSDYDALAQAGGIGADRALAADRAPYNRWRNIERRPEWATDAMRLRLSYWRARYGSGVRALDRRLGDVLHRLRKNGLLDESYFVFTSDHGEELFEHGDWSHGRSLFDHQLRIPLIVRAPEGRNGGTRTEAMAQHVDLMPTLLSLAAVRQPDGLQGRDLSSVVRGTATAGAEDVYATATETNPGLYALRTPTHKFLLDIETGARQLFDLVADPDEQHDVASAQPALADELQDRLAAHLASSVARGVLEAETAEVSEEIQERLKALGY